MQIIISNRFRDDITEIYKYIARDSFKYADETVRNINSKIDYLDSLPYIGRYVPELQNKHLRELLYKNYRIIYEVFQKNNIVYIQFIIHNKRNFKSFYKAYFN